MELQASRVASLICAANVITILSGEENNELWIFYKLIIKQQCLKLVFDKQ